MENQHKGTKELLELLEIANSASGSRAAKPPKSEGPPKSDTLPRSDTPPVSASDVLATDAIDDGWGVDSNEPVEPQVESQVVSGPKAAKLATTGPNTRSPSEAAEQPSDTGASSSRSQRTQTKAESCEGAPPLSSRVGPKPAAQLTRPAATVTSTTTHRAPLTPARTTGSNSTRPLTPSSSPNRTPKGPVSSRPASGASHPSSPARQASPDSRTPQAKAKDAERAPVSAPIRSTRSAGPASVPRPGLSTTARTPRPPAVASPPDGRMPPDLFPPLVAAAPPTRGAPPASDVTMTPVAATLRSMAPEVRPSQKPPTIELVTLSPAPDVARALQPDTIPGARVPTPAQPAHDLLGLGALDGLVAAPETPASPDSTSTRSRPSVTETDSPAAIDLPLPQEYGRNPRRARRVAAAVAVVVLGGGAVAAKYGTQDELVRRTAPSVQVAQPSLPNARQNVWMSASSTSKPALQPAPRAASGARPQLETAESSKPPNNSAESSTPADQSASLQDSFKAALRKQAADQSARDPVGDTQAEEQSATKDAVKDAPVMAVTFVVNPVDAAVYRNGAVEGATPLRYGIKKGQVLVLQVARPGFHSRTVRLDGTQTKVSVTLKKINADDPLFLNNLK